MGTIKNVQACIPGLIRTQVLIVSLLMLISSTGSVQADPIIDHVRTEQSDSQEIIDIVFNRPVQYLYHTPKTASRTVLLGFYLQPSAQQGKPGHRPVPFRHTELLQGMEIFFEQGFNPHLYLEFAQAVVISVTPGDDMRGFILTITRQQLP